MLTRDRIIFPLNHFVGHGTAVLFGYVEITSISGAFQFDFDGSGFCHDGSSCLAQTGGFRSLEKEINGTPGDDPLFVRKLLIGDRMSRWCRSNLGWLQFLFQVVLLDPNLAVPLSRKWKTKVEINF